MSFLQHTAGLHGRMMPVQTSAIFDGQTIKRNTGNNSPTGRTHASIKESIKRNVATISGRRKNRKGGKNEPQQKKSERRTEN